MSWTNFKGFNFRSTLAFVTDGANETFINAGVSYPTTTVIDGDSVTYGFEDFISSGRTIDMNSGIDPRLAGVAGVVVGEPEVRFRIDLPATGSYEIRTAWGDGANPRVQTGEIRDTNTAFITISGTTATGEFRDATNVTRTSSADWVANNVTVTRTMASTILRAVIQVPASDASTLAHIAVRQVGGGTLAFDEGVWQPQEQQTNPLTVSVW